jgi:hypothetical protein
VPDEEEQRLKEVRKNLKTLLTTPASLENERIKGIAVPS